MFRLLIASIFCEQDEPVIFFSLFNIIIAAGLLMPSIGSSFGLQSYDEVLQIGFVKIEFASPDRMAKFQIPEGDAAAAIKHFCEVLDEAFRKYHWEKSPCGEVAWRSSNKTKDGHPLIYTVFGEGTETTLFFGGVHADELLPIPMAFRFARHLRETHSLYEGKNVRVVVAPIINPDGFLRDKPTRFNGNGIDLNRNFFTRDWYGSSRQQWNDSSKKSPRHFPGLFPNSEIETLFQIQLVENFSPAKILSLHSPLGFLDYDGPGNAGQPQTSKTEPGKKLVELIAKTSNNYRIQNYGFYPGSLGNFAGNERHIPTVTLEMDSINPEKLDAVWSRFLPGFIESIQYQVNQNSVEKGRAFGEFREPPKKRI